MNDGPALRHADIGVAMGRRGTEVARQAADLVLADDELGTMVTAISEGRRIYDNVRRFLLFGMSGGAAEIMVMLAGPFLGMALPLLPAQILWINLLTHGLTGVALGAEPAAEAVMRRPPRPPAESVLGAGLWKRILRIAVLITAVTLVVALWGHISGREWQTMAFLTLGTMQLTVAIALRARPRTWANPFLLVAVGSAWLLQLSAVYVPPLAELLGTQPLPLRRPRRRHRGIPIGLRRHPAGPQAAPAIARQQRSVMMLRYRTFAGNVGWRLSGHRRSSPLASQLASRQTSQLGQSPVRSRRSRPPAVKGTSYARDRSASDRGQCRSDLEPLACGRPGVGCGPRRSAGVLLRSRRSQTLSPRHR